MSCDGSNGGTTFTDSSYWQHPATVGGNTHTDTAVKKFGTASAQFDGTTGNDYLEFATASGFGLGTGDWTIDWWCRSPDWSAGSAGCSRAVHPTPRPPLLTPSISRDALVLSHLFRVVKR